MSAPITNTIQLVMSRVSEKEFDHELIETAIADIATHPFRKVQLRIPLRPIEDEEFVSFTNEMFGGHDNEDYSPIFAEMLSYNGNTAANAEQAKSKTFKVPLGYANIHIIFAKKKARCDIRTNLNGETKYLNKFCLIPLAAEHASFVETETTNGGAILKNSNALFLSKYALINVDEPKRSTKATGDDDDAQPASHGTVGSQRMSYSNAKFIEYLNMLKKQFTVGKPDLTPYIGDLDQRETVYVIKLDDCSVTIDTDKTRPNSFGRLKVIYYALQAHLRRLDMMQVTIANKNETINGKLRPVKFAYMVLPPDEGKGGRVVLPDDITLERCTVPLSPFSGKLFGFGHPTPDDETIYNSVKDFCYVYGFHIPQDLDYTDYRERKQRLPQQNGAHSNGTHSNGTHSNGTHSNGTHSNGNGAAPAAASAPTNGNRSASGNGSKAKEFFQQRGGASGGRGVSRGRGN